MIIVNQLDTALLDQIVLPSRWTENHAPTQCSLLFDLASNYEVIFGIDNVSERRNGSSHCEALSSSISRKGARISAKIRLE
jgi:hypothetical protein